MDPAGAQAANASPTGTAALRPLHKLLAEMSWLPRAVYSNHTNELLDGQTQVLTKLVQTKLVSKTEADIHTTTLLVNLLQGSMPWCQLTTPTPTTPPTEAWVWWRTTRHTHVKLTMPKSHWGGYESEGDLQAHWTQLLAMFADIPFDGLLPQEAQLALTESIRCAGSRADITIKLL